MNCEICGKEIKKNEAIMCDGKPICIDCFLA